MLFMSVSMALKTPNPSGTWRRPGSTGMIRSFKPAVGDREFAAVAAEGRGGGAVFFSLPVPVASCVAVFAANVGKPNQPRLTAYSAAVTQRRAGCPTVDANALDSTGTSIALAKSSAHHLAASSKTDMFFIFDIAWAIIFGTPA